MDTNFTLALWSIVGDCTLKRRLGRRGPWPAGALLYQETVMKLVRRIVTGGLIAVAGLLGAAGVAQARNDVYWSLGVGAPGVSVGVGNAPVYVAPQPVYVQPGPVYVQPEPYYVRPRPVYGPPAYYAPPPRVVYRPAPGYYYGPSRGYYRNDYYRHGRGDRHHGRGHHRGWN